MDERETRPLHVQLNQDAFGEKLAELIAENDRLRGERAQLLDLVREAVVVHNLEAGTISFWNPGAEALYGYAPDEAIGRVADELLDTRFPRPLKAIESELLRHGSWEGELVQRCKNGARRVILSRWALQHDESGRPRSILEVNSDVTPQKQEAETHAELAAIVQYAQDAIMSTDTTGRVMSWNSAAERLFGYKAAEVVGKPGHRLVPEGLWDEVDSIHARLREGKSVPTYETQRLRKDGATIDVSVTASSIRDAHDAVIGFSLAMRDISERVRAERALRESERRFRAMFESAPIGVVLFDGTGRLVEVNPAFVSFIGRDAAALKRMHFKALTHPDDLAANMALYESLLRGERDQYQMEKRYVRPDGEAVWGRLTVALLRSASAGEEARLIAMVEDIGEEKEAQALMEARMQALEEADRVKDQFLGILSHELRTPINAIMGFASVLEDELAGPLNADQHRFVERILGGADLLLGLVEELLDLSRLQAGRLELACEPVDLAEAARHVAHQLNSVASELGCSVAVVEGEAVPRVLADAQRVRQVLTHLLTNAIKFSADGPCTVTVAIEPRGEAVRCAVSDRGIGIAESDLGRLFKPFSQLDMTDTRDAGGTGIGLSIVKAMVVAMGGSVGVESRVGEGSTFWFTLPAVLAS